MLLAAHLSFAGLIGVLVFNDYRAFIAVIGSLLPDLDFKFNIGHRGFTHSLHFLLFSFILPELGMGVLSHLILDTLTPRGIRFLWPFRADFVVFNGNVVKNERESAFFAVFMCFLGSLAVAYRWFI